MMRSPLRDADEPNTPGGGGAPRRSGSMTLREEGARGGDRGAMLDPANQSLAEALRVMMFLLQGGMAVLAIAYLASGFQWVREGERGIRLLFGRIEAASIDPGFVWSAPFPLGELVKVEQGNLELVIDRDFWPDWTSDPSADKLTPEMSLKPGKGGSVITADGNIAHTRWKVVYKRERADQWAQNLYPGANGDNEKNLVRAAVKQGIVQACARTTIEELLKQSGDETGSVREFARQVAQRSLDDSKSGIQIELLAPIETIPPLFIRRDFAQAQASVSNASKAVENAQSEGARLLFSTAGRAAPYLVERLEAFEAAATQRDAAESSGDAAALRAANQKLDDILAQIDALMTGQAVELPPGTVKVAGTPTRLEGGKVEGLAGGTVAETMVNASAYRSAVVNRSQADLRRFQAKLELYKANPKVMLQREWAESVLAFVGRDSVQQFMLPEGVNALSFLINADPDIAREMSKAQKDRERKRAEDERMMELRKNEFKTDTNPAPEIPG